MKLNATVIAVHAKSGNSDGLRRVTLCVTEAEMGDRRFIVKSDDLREDEELVVLVFTKKDADLLRAALTDTGLVSRSVRELYDQLRPDEPPPFLSDDAKAALKFTKQFMADVDANAPQPTEAQVGVER